MTTAAVLELIVAISYLRPVLVNAMNALPLRQRMVRAARQEG